VVDDIEDGCFPHASVVPVLLAVGIPVCRVPESSRNVEDVDGVGSQVLSPQPLHLLVEMRIDPSHAQHGTNNLGAVRTVNIGKS
jgi:hypothetical protein